MISPQASISRNTLYNLVAALAPIVVALVTVPIYLNQIGDARYGVLAIVWLLVGYLGVLNAGMSRATTNRVARLSNAPHSDVEATVWSAATLSFSLGLIAGGLLYLIGAVLLEQMVTMSPELRSEAIASLRWLAIGMPAILVASVLAGSLEGQEKFRTVSAVTVIITVVTQVSPLIVAISHAPYLPWLVGTVVVVQWINMVLLMGICIVSLPLRARPTFSSSEARQLLGYGGWVSISGFLTPLLTTADQMLISAKLGVRFVPLYSIPYSLVTRFSILPLSLSRTVFPRFSHASPEEGLTLSRQTSVMLAAFMTPLIVCAMIILRPFLEVWIGSERALDAAPVGELLLLGVWANGLAAIPFSLLQGSGRPDLPAKLHVIELVPYLLVLWIALSTMGLVGAALAWTVRAVADAILLHGASQMGLRHLLSILPPAVLLLITFFLAGTLFRFDAARVILGGGVLVASLVWSYPIIFGTVRSLFEPEPVH